VLRCTRIEEAPSGAMVAASTVSTKSMWILTIKIVGGSMEVMTSVACT
jgi:hypothetical protein